MLVLMVLDDAPVLFDAVSGAVKGAVRRWAPFGGRGLHGLLELDVALTRR
jgi:hypothetical protein